MLKLSDIVRTYDMGDTHVEALRGVSLEFRKSDFVSILGPSGCGKTTMLNIIGGLDRYTSGDLTINGISTKEYKDGDWDIYRNNSIGFVFQSYNLIPHQTVFANVELALTLAGISRAERHRRVTEVLEKVGLGDQIHKKPTQMSGGQMQRVAIARALVNNPDIVLADEPTGALDSETSTQIMELLKEIAKDRLVIMVTHNPDIAEKYSTRIIKLLDGKVVGDTNPYASDQAPVKKEKGKRKKVSLTFPTALSLSLKNLLTKKTRTILTAFAGSIGIIGIALILSLSSGMRGYIANLERDTLSTYPIELQSQTMDLSDMMSVMMESHSGGEEHALDKVYANNIMSSMMQSVTTSVTPNDLKLFKEYIESDEGRAFRDVSNTIQYEYAVNLQIYSPDTSDGILKINPSDIFQSFGMSESMNDMMGGSSFGSFSMGTNSSVIWSQMLDDEDLLHSQYDVVAGRWPAAFNEVVLIVDEDNELSDMVLYTLGLLDQRELDEMVKKAMKGEAIEEIGPEASFTYDEILSLSYKLLLSTDYYAKSDDHWADRREDEAYMKSAIENATDLNVVGIIRPSADAVATSIGGAIGYTSALMDYVIGATLESEIAKEQLSDPETNVFTGYSFLVDDFIANLTMDDVLEALEQMPEAQRAQAQTMIESLPEQMILSAFAEQIKLAAVEQTTYEENLSTLGIVDFNSPSSIKIYPKDFESKTKIEEMITAYNQTQEENGNEEAVIHYTDFVGLMTSSVSSIIDIISYVLIAFVAISLVVSSIMIAIITYISVLERTKEIGILRSIGASKSDIARVFNAETIIEGFTAGAMGVGITILLNFPINAIIESLTGIPGISALPVYGAISLTLLSVLLTVIAGLIPSRMAARKDPVEALRTE